MRTPIVSLREALAEDTLLGGILGGPSWKNWRVVLMAALGEELTWTERRIFKKLSGGRRPPREPCDTLCAVIGRRGGKSRAISVLATYLACLCEYPSVAAPGERLKVLCLARNTDQAHAVFNFIAGIFDTVPVFGGMVSHRTSDCLTLSNGVDVEVRAATFGGAGLRGLSAVAVIGDEAAHWDTNDAAKNADTEILNNACRPMLATTNGMLAVISSPYTERGEVFEIWRDHYGPKSDPGILVVHGDSRTFNPDLPQYVVDRAMKRDPVDASAEYGAIFRSNEATALIARNAVMACVVKDRYELKPLPDVSYMGVIDPSGLDGKDSYALAIGHRDPFSDRAVIDCVREWQTGVPTAVSAEAAQLLRSYGISMVYGDPWGSNWVRQPLRELGIEFAQLPMTKSEAYLEFLGICNSGAVELLANEKAIEQICSLQRRTGRSGRDSVDARGGIPEDMANVIAAVCAMIEKNGRRHVRFTCLSLGGDGAVLDGRYSAVQYDPNYFEAPDGGIENNTESLSDVVHCR
jgi:hypothetical protein